MNDHHGPDGAVVSLVGVNMSSSIAERRNPAARHRPSATTHGAPVRRDLLRLATRLLVLGAPLAALVAFYVGCDPFKVLYHHDSYYGPQDRVSLNRDCVSTELYASRPVAERPDAFIFGNSRSLAFLCSDWQRHIDSPRVFHFDASGETLFGIWSKVNYIDRSGGSLRHALIVVDSETLADTRNSSGHLFIKDPRVSGESAATFQLLSFRAFLARGFFIKYLDFRCFATFRPYMNEAIESRQFAHDPATNDLRFTSVEAEIASLGEAYYSAERGLFPRRESSSPGVTSRVLFAQELAMLKEIQSTFDRHNTNCRIAVSPLYQQVRLNPDDVAELRKVFGADRVYDYSGVNEFTEDVHNYYESSHYRPVVAREIMHEFTPIIHPHVPRGRRNHQRGWSDATLGAKRVR